MMDTKTNNSNEYMKTKVLTASPEQLQLLLYDGAIRFCEQARSAIIKKEIENSYQLLIKAEKIIMELHDSMRDEVAPETCSKMRSLYMFCYERLVAANLKKEIKPLDEALQVLRHVRQTWIMLLEKLQAEKCDQPDETGDTHQNPISEEIGATISLEG